MNGKQLGNLHDFALNLLAIHYFQKEWPSIFTSNFLFISFVYFILFLFIPPRNVQTSTRQERVHPIIYIPHAFVTSFLLYHHHHRLTFKSQQLCSSHPISFLLFLFITHFHLCNLQKITQRNMVYKTLEITLISAKDLKNVNLIGKMDPYVVVHLSDEPKNKQKTPVHQDGGTNPAWNYTMRFTVDDAAASKPGKYVIFTLKHEHTFGADKDLGEVLVPLKELLDGVQDLSVPKVVTYQVKRVSSQKAQGELKLSYKFIDMPNNMGSYGKGEYKPSQPCSSSSSAAPYPPPGGYGNVYPPPHHQTVGGYPPSQSQAPPPAAGIPYAAPAGYPPQSHGAGVPYAAPPGAAPHGYPQYGGYPPPPAPGYGYPPPGAYPPPGGYPGYSPAGGYAQKPQKPKKSGGMGMGLGAGLLGGAIGGLVLGEMMDDAFDVDCDF